MRRTLWIAIAGAVAHSLRLAGRCRFRSMAGLAALTALALLASACGDDDDEAEAGAVRVLGTDYAFDMPSEIEGGVVTMDFVTEGQEPHEYALGRLAPSRTLADLNEVLESGREPPPWLDDIGGVPAMTPGEEISITRELQPGTYAFLCFIPTPDGRPHYELGMRREFTVTGDSEASLPEPDGVISAGDDRIEVPDVQAGEQTLELRNTASKPREFELFTFDEGEGPAELGKWFRSGYRGEPPARLLGAMQSIAPRTSVFLTEEFDAGATYFVEDRESGLRARFTVR